MHNDGDVEGDPSFGPAGLGLAFERDLSGNSEVFSAVLDGPGPTHLPGAGRHRRRSRGTTGRVVLLTLYRTSLRKGELMALRLSLETTSRCRHHSPGEMRAKLERVSLDPAAAESVDSAPGSPTTASAEGATGHHAGRGHRAGRRGHGHRADRRP